MNGGKKILFLLFSACLLAPVNAHPQARLLSKTGFVDLDRIVYEYATSYLDSEIARREKSLELVRESTPSRRARDPKEEHESIEEKIREHREALGSLRRDRDHLARTGELRSNHLAEIVETDVLNAVRKTAEIEGFSIVLDTWGNFVYGSPEVDLTDKVLLRLLRDMSGTANDE
jgi:Skp family chaperone for outer membrane proteins